MWQPSWSYDLDHLEVDPVGSEGVRLGGSGWVQRIEVIVKMHGGPVRS